MVKTKKTPVRKMAPADKQPCRLNSRQPGQQGMTSASPLRKSEAGKVTKRGRPKQGPGRPRLQAINRSAPKPQQCSRAASQTSAVSEHVNQVIESVAVGMLAAQPISTQVAAAERVVSVPPSPVARQVPTSPHSAIMFAQGHDLNMSNTGSHMNPFTTPTGGRQQQSPDQTGGGHGIMNMDTGAPDSGSHACATATPTNIQDGCGNSQADTTLSRQTTFTLDGLNSALQSIMLQMGSTNGTPSMRNQAMGIWDGVEHPSQSKRGCSNLPQTDMASVDQQPRSTGGNMSDSQNTAEWNNVLEQARKHRDALAEQLKQSESVISDIQQRVTRPDLRTLVNRSQDPISGHVSCSGNSRHDNEEPHWRHRARSSSSDESEYHALRKYRLARKRSRSTDCSTSEESHESDCVCEKWKRAKRSRSSVRHPAIVISGNDSDMECSDETSDMDTGTGSKPPRPGRYNMIPPFTGEGEKWEVWFARFEAVAANQGWSDAECLSALLPLLRKSDGDYAFGTLSKKAWTDYRVLIKGLTKRFKGKESVKSFQTKWSNLKQSPDQTVEDLAAHIRWLHAKAYPGRDESTQREDMLLKFFEALSDKNARVAVEFTKKPRDIDEALDCVVQYNEIRKVGDSKSGGRARAVRKENDFDLSFLDEEDESAEDPKPDHTIRAAQVTDTDSQQKKRRAGRDQGSGGRQTNYGRQRVEDRVCHHCNQQGHIKKYCPARQSTATNKETRACFNCQQVGHLIKDCPVLLAGATGANQDQSGQKTQNTAMTNQQPGAQIPTNGQAGYPMLVFAGPYPSMGMGGVPTNGQQPGQQPAATAGGVASVPQPSSRVDGAHQQTASN